MPFGFHCLIGRKVYSAEETDPEVESSALHDSYHLMKHRSYALVLLLAVVVGSLKLEADVPAHNTYTVNYSTRREELYTGEQYTMPLDDLHFEFSSQVYERTNPLEDNILDDYEGQMVRNSTAYAVLYG